MKTRIQKLLVCAALVGAATLVQAQFNYTNNGDGTCTITGYTGPGGAVIIPNSINGLSVVSIGYEAFYGTRLASVIIPDSVTTIGDYAFSETGLTSLTIGNGVTSIGGDAFAFCSGLTSVTFPNSVTNIGDAAFYYCSLTNLNIGNGVTSIGGQAFYRCRGLTNVTIPAGVTNLGSGAFGGCYAMTAITVDAANSFYSSANGVLFDKNQTTLIEFPAGRGGSYTIPASVTSIGNSAFFTCINLTNVTIPNSVTNIGPGAFGFCTSLPSVTIPDSVTSIGYRAFYNCTSLTSVTIPASVTSIGFQAFYNCTSLRAAYFLGNAPSYGGSVFGADFGYDPVIVYYLPGAMGWGPIFSDAPTELWNPQASALGVTGGHFGFDISGPSNTVVVVEACTNLVNPAWLPVSTNALEGSGASSFSDSQSGIYPARFYRFRSP